MTTYHGRIAWFFLNEFSFSNAHLLLPLDRLSSQGPLFMSIRARPHLLRHDVCASPVAEESVVQKHTDKNGHRQEK